MATAAITETAMSRWRLKLPDRLPDLKSKWLTLYVMIWAIMLPLAIIGPVRNAYTFYGWQSKPAWIAYGLQLTEDGDDLRILTGLTAEARGAGMKQGDRIVAIDDWKVPDSPTALTDARVHMVKPEGSSTVFRLIGEDGAVRDVRLTYSWRHLDEVFRGTGLSQESNAFIQIASALIRTLGLVAAAVLLFVRQRRQAVPAFLSLSFLMLGATSGSWGDLGISTVFVDLVTVTGISLLFASLFGLPDGQLTTWWIRVAVFALPLLGIADALFGLGDAGNAIPAFLCVVLIVAFVRRYRSFGAGPERQQMRWAFLGFGVGISLLTMAILASAVAERMILSDSRWYAATALVQLFFTISILSMAAGVMISMLKYRLYDADVAIGRSAAFGVLTLGFVALFAGSEKLVEVIGERYFEQSIGMAAGAIGAAVAAVCIVPLHNRIHHWAERRFQKPLIRLREGLPKAVSDLREIAPVEELASAAIRRVHAGVHSTHEAVLLWSAGKYRIIGARGISKRDIQRWQTNWQPSPGEHPLDCKRDDALFPLRLRLSIETGSEPETVGWMLLGPRPDGSFFGKDERETLEQVADPIARSIHIAKIREGRDRRQQVRMGEIERLLESVIEGFQSSRRGASHVAALAP